MKKFVSIPVFIYSLIKKNFFIVFHAKINKCKINPLEAKKEQQNFTDEYHKAFSGVTRWQTL